MKPYLMTMVKQKGVGQVTMRKESYVGRITRLSEVVRDWEAKKR